MPSLMADPSLILGSAGQELIESGEVEIVVSQSFAEWISNDDDFDPDRFQPDDGDEDPRSYVERIRELLKEGRIGTFSYETALVEGQLSDEARFVLDRLLEQDDRVARIDADQWAFLNANSWLGSQARRALDAFERAGAAVLEAGRDIGIEMLDKVIPADGRPRNVDAGLIARGVIKWLVVGGATIGGGLLGGTAGLFIGGPVGGWFGEVIGRQLGKRGAMPVVIAVDP